MGEYYHNLTTEKSFEILKNLKRKFRFILIGGWAVFLYTKALKSKDIDIVLDYSELGKFKKEFEVLKNERLKKYEIKIEEIDIDIYLPHYSRLGIPVESIKKYTQSVEGFLAPMPEILLILKVYTFLQRKGSNKGTKDLIDIFSLFKQDIIDWQKYKKLIKEYGLSEVNENLKKLINSTRSLSELKLLNHQLSKLKKKVLGNLL